MSEPLLTRSLKYCWKVVNNNGINLYASIFCNGMQIIEINYLIPKFLKRTLPSLNLDLSTVACLC